MSEDHLDPDIAFPLSEEEMERFKAENEAWFKARKARLQSTKDPAALLTEQRRGDTGKTR